MDQPDVMEPIAIIGLALKFPQDATDADGFWRMLMEGQSAMTDVPKERFNVDAHFDPDPEAPGMLSYRGGHFIKDDIACFDAPFFSITPAEASCLDPLQRGLLECSYRALENAGIPIEKVSGTKTSVHIGSGGEYQTLFRCDSEMEAKYLATGSGRTMMANRLSWFYNFLGPSVALDTACSSSLVALHLACQALRCGDASMGLVGGANLIYDTAETSHFTHLGFFSPDSISYGFDHRANGYSRGEGFGMVVIKMLSQALQDGDTIRAVIRATGSNQDGRTPGITQPSSESQAMLIRETYARAGLDLKTTRFFEAHGTGTQVGDVLEAKAMGAVFGSQRSPEEPLIVGALKSGFGHLEAASGVAALIKTVLVLEQGVIPGNVWFEKRNPSIEESWNLQFPTQPIPWPTEGLRRASVNSFGFGGSNAHAILDDAHHYLQQRGLAGRHHTKAPAPSSSYTTKAALARHRLFVWSANDEAGVQRIANTYAAHLEARPTEPSEENTFLESLAFTFSSKRSALPWRAFAAADSLAELRTKIVTAQATRSRVTPTSSIGFIFTGQGAQYRAMGRELLEFYPVYRESIVEADLYLRSLGCKWSVFDILAGNITADVDDPAYSQPFCTAVQIALVELLRHLKVHPAAVVGHSSGEIAAAYCMGGLSKESALNVAYYRGVLSARLAQNDGLQVGMMAVALSQEAMQPHLADINKMGQGHIAVGCVNSSVNVTITGSRSALAELRTRLRKQNIFCALLKVQNAYHSEYMEELVPEYTELLRNLQSGASCPASGTDGGQPPVMVSTVTGEVISRERLTDAGYWAQNLVSKVAFFDAFRRMVSQTSKHGRGLDYVLEVGPHGALSRYVRDICGVEETRTSLAYDTLLTRGIPAMDTLLSAMGRLHSNGFPVDLESLNGVGKGVPMPVDLPGYPFNHSQVHWTESRISINTRFRKNRRNKLLGSPVPDWNPNEARWRMYLGTSRDAWIREREVAGVVTYPESGIIAMAIEAVRQVVSPDRITGFRFKSVLFEKSLAIPPTTDGIEIQFSLRLVASDPQSSSPPCYDFKLCSFGDGEWADHCRGRVIAELDHNVHTLRGQQQHDTHETSLLEEAKVVAQRCVSTVEPDSLYELLDMSGVGFGPSFRPLQSVRYNFSGEAATHLEVQAGFEAGDGHINVIHPTTLDGLLQGIFPAMFRGGQAQIEPLRITSIAKLWIASSIASRKFIHACTTSRTVGLKQASFSILGMDSSQQTLLFAASNLSVVSNHDHGNPTTSLSRYLCYNIDWKPDVDILDIAGPPLLQNLFSTPETRALAAPGEQIVDLEFIAFCFLCRSNSAIKAREKMPTEPHLLKQLAWMRRQLERYGRNELTHAAPNWHTLITDQSYVEKKMQEAFESWEGKLLLRMGPCITEVLMGEVDPLALMFQDDIMSNAYRFGYGTDIACMKAERYIDFLAHKNPGMRILEVGGGTGSVTGSVLRTLCRGEEDNQNIIRLQSYTFTDVSAAFFDGARHTCAEYLDKMTFQVFDVQLDPAEQGLDVGAYDLVIAASAIHISESVESALRNVRRLLKPGGKLALFEVCHPDALRGNLIFGLLPGWWLAVEQKREWCPLMKESDWDRCFRNTGFSGTDHVIRDWEDPSCHMTSFMVTTAASPESTTQLPVPGVFIISNRESSLQRKIAKKLAVGLGALGIQTADSITLKDVLGKESMSDTFCIFLEELERPFLASIDQHGYECLKRLLQSEGLLWLRQGNSEPAFDLVVGFARCARSEVGSLNFTTLAVENWQDAAFVANISLRIAQESGLLSGEKSGGGEEYAERDGLIHINRFVEAKYINECVSPAKRSQNVVSMPLQLDSPMKLAVGTPGLLDTVHFTEDGDVKQAMGDQEVELQVKATGMNFLDVSTVLAEVPNKHLGYEASGIVTRAGKRSRFKPGDHVFAVGFNMYRTVARTEDALVQLIPPSLSYDETAGMAIHYGLCYHALFNVARLQPGEKVLIHYGARGLGQAAIRLAKHVRAEVITTVSSDEKRLFLIEEFGLPEDHILSSRDLTAFSLGIMHVTGGNGVDVVLNAMTGNGLTASWECLAPFGRFIELGTKDIMEGRNLPMSMFSKSVSFAAVDFLHIMRENTTLARQVFDEVNRLMTEGVAVSAKPLQVFSYSDIEAALRELQSGNHMGKVVAVPKSGEVVPFILTEAPTWAFDANGTYVLAGGLGGIGRSMARWMAGRGARNLVLLSRSGIASDTSRAFVSELESLGCRVKAPRCDIADRSQLSNVLSKVKDEMPPIKGCIQGALVLRDASFVDMTYEDFMAALGPKVQGSWNLHELLPPGMDFFILLSSFSGIVGFPGQANYCAGNTYQDALARYRVSHGEKATALDLGMILSVGFSAERPDLAKKLRARGYMSIRETELLAVLEYHCNPSLPLPSSLRTQVVMGAEIPATLRHKGIDEPYWMSRPLFRGLHNLGGAEPKGAKSTGPVSRDFRTLLGSAKSLVEAGAIVSEALAWKLARTLSLPEGDIALSKPVHSYGVDSLAAVDIRNWMQREIRAQLAAPELLKNISIADLGLIIAEKSGYLSEGR